MSTTHHLMTEAKPTHYTLSLTPCLQTATFTGTVAIKILILSTTIALKLNAHELAISNVTLLSSSSSDEFPIASTSTNTETQTFKILLKDHVTANTNLVLKLEFAGVLRRDGEGLGWFLPLAAQGGGGGFAVTQFEPILARTTFPCFDDPSFKAVFSVQMTIPRNLTALSNMPVRSTEDMDVDVAEAVVVKERKKVVLFEDTPVIPTYLLAFVVGDFEFLELENGNGNGNGKEDEDKDEVVLRAYVPKGAEYKVEQCRYGLQTAKRCINILSSLLEYPFPLPKLDLLLVPGMCGGMENWGLITLATKSFLVAADNSAADKVVVAQIIAHEIAHTWFGNLVTPTSWDDFWFKEGLSEWAELECRERMEGDLEPFKDWAADGLQVAIFASAWKQVHPLVAKVGDEVAKPMFDDTTYRKGCAVIIMLANYLRDEFFIQGLRLFVRLHAFGNATSEDLWSAMSQVSGADVGAFVRPWVKGLGIPLVEVGEIEKPFRVNVKQSTFRMARLEAVEEDDNLLPIPLEVVTAKGISGELLSERAKLIKMTPDFYSVNRGNAGFFIVGYSADRLRCICQDMHKGTLSVKERIGLISNAAALVWSCHPSMRTSDLLNLLQHFEDEENFFVWKVIISVLEGLKRYLMFENDKMIVAFERFWKRLVKRCLYRIGRCSVDDNINEQRFKAMLFGNSGGDDMVFKAAEVMFRCFVKKEGKSINPNLRAEVFKVVLRKKGKREYNELKSRLKDASVAERNDILGTLGYSHHSNCIKKTIKLAFSDEIISRNEMFQTAYPLCTHAQGVDALWKFIASGLWMQNPLLSKEKMASIGTLIFLSYTKREQSDEARKVLEKMSDTNELGPEFEQGFDFIEAKARWRERDNDDLVGWLNRNGHIHEDTRRGVKMFGFNGFRSGK